MRTLVATVGISPMPVLLSCLTLHAQGEGLDQVVLVHSGDVPFGPPGTADTAGRIEQGLVRLVADPPEISRISLGEGVTSSDIDGVENALHESVDDLVDVAVEDEVMLDYTGGTKAMAAAAVRWHLARSGGAGAHQRFYVDETVGVIRPDEGEELTLTVPTSLTLTEMAELHGFQLRAGTEPEREDERQAAQWFLDAIANHRGRGQCSVCRGLGVTPGPGVGEVLWNIDICQPVTGRKISQFDVLARWGHRVVTVEAKTHSEQFYVSAGWAYARSKAVFGRAAQSCFLSTRPGEPAPSVVGMRDHIAWSGIDPNPVTQDWMAKNNAVAAKSFHQFFRSRPHDSGAQHFPRRQASTDAGLVVVSAVGSARMAPAAALASAIHTVGGPLRGVELLTSPQNRRGETDELNIILKAVANGASITRRQVDLGATGEITEQVKEILDFAGDAPVVLDGTAGPKAATAGMAVAAAGRGNARLVCTDVRRRLTSSPGDGVRAAPVVDLPFHSLLESNGYICFPPGELPGGVPGDLRMVAGVVVDQLGNLTDHGSTDPTLWVPQRLPGVGGDHQLSLVVVAAWDRLIGLAQAPEYSMFDNPGGGKDQNYQRVIADFASTAALYLEALAGDATQTVLLYRRSVNDPPDPQRRLRMKLEDRLQLAHPSAERPIRVCLFQASGEPDRDTHQILQRLVRNLYAASPIPVPLAAAGKENKS